MFLNVHFFVYSLADWQDVIEKFGGRVVSSYDENREEITHVLAPNRFGDVYKKVSGKAIMGQSLRCLRICEFL